MDNYTLNILNVCVGYGTVMTKSLADACPLQMATGESVNKSVAYATYNLSVVTVIYKILVGKVEREKEKKNNLTT